MKERARERKEREREREGEEKETERQRDSELPPPVAISRTKKKTQDPAVFQTLVLHAYCIHGRVHFGLFYFLVLHQSPLLPPLMHLRGVSFFPREGVCPASIGVPIEKKCNTKYGEVK